MSAPGQDLPSFTPMLDQLANQGGPGALLFRHFWLVLIVVTVVNGVAAQRRIKPVVDHNPSLADGYQRLFRGYFVWANVPWVLMGIGIVFGGVPTVHHYLLAFDLLMVRIWWVAVGGLLAAGTVWMLIGGGADALARHPGLPHVPRWSAAKLKLFWVGVVIWNAVIGGFMLTGFGRNGLGASFGFAFPFLFVGTWIGVSYLLAAVGGWSTLAKDYRCDFPLAGGLLRMRSGRVGIVNYGSCLNLGSSADGLYLATMLPFRLAHPPLFIPWSEMSHHDTKRFYFFDVTEIRFAKHPAIVLELRRALAHELLSRRPARAADG